MKNWLGFFFFFSNLKIFTCFGLTSNWCLLPNGTPARLWLRARPVDSSISLTIDSYSDLFSRKYITKSDDFKLFNFMNLEVFFPSGIRSDTFIRGFTDSWTPPDDIRVISVEVNYWFFFRHSISKKDNVNYSSRKHFIWLWLLWLLGPELWSMQYYICKVQRNAQIGLNKL